MMLHRKDFENHNFSFKIHCKPIYSMCYAYSGPEGIIHYSKSTEPPKIQEIAISKWTDLEPNTETEFGSNGLELNGHTADYRYSHIFEQHDDSLYISVWALQ